MKKEVSFLIPAKNEEKYLLSLIENIKHHMKKWESYEIIVANNASTDRTGAIAANHADQVFWSDAKTVAGVRNEAAKHASGNLLVFVDADIELTQEWFDYLHERTDTLIENKVVTGFRCVPPQSSIFYKFWASGLSTPDYVPTGNLLVSAEGFDDIGGFNDKLGSGEDVDFSMRAKALGYFVGLPPLVANREVIHKGAPRTIGKFFRQQMWHGFGDYSTILTFFGSLIATYSMLTIFTLVAALGLSALDSPQAGKAYLLFFLFLMFFSVFQFPELKFRYRPINMWLGFVYMLARTCALTSLGRGGRPYEVR